VPGKAAGTAIANALSASAATSALGRFSDVIARRIYIDNTNSVYEPLSTPIKCREFGKRKSPGNPGLFKAGVPGLEPRTKERIRAHGLSREKVRKSA
jgi:hypothetical protein